MTDRARMSYRFGPFVLDRSEHALLRDGRPVHIPPKVFDLLWILVENHGHLVSKDRLAGELWPDTFVDDNSLNRSVSVLRRILNPAPGDPPYIQTVPKRGYRFIGDVMESPAAVDVTTSGADALRTRSKPRPLMWTVGIGAAGLLALFWYSKAGYDGVRVEAPPAVHRQVTFGGKESVPAVSPDGTRIAYVSSDAPQRKAVVQDLSDSHTRVLFTAPEIGGLHWSPDGSSLLLYARGENQDGLYVLPASGGEPHRISARGPVACWSPDGSSIVVAQPLVGRLTIVNTKGDELRSVTLRDVHRWIWDVDWSRAANRLLVVANDDDGRFTIWTLAPDGTDQREVVTESAEIPAARWAGSGRSIYYFRRDGQTYSLYKAPDETGLDAHTTAASPLLTGLETDGPFELSGDGARLVYTRVPYHSNLWRVDTGGPAHRTVTTRQLTTGTALVERPAISPDGSRVVFNIGRDPIANLYMVSASGGAPKQVTFLNAFSLAGVWSADGRSIAFASNEQGRRRVWIVDPAGRSPRPLSTGDMSDSFQISWAPGSEILYQQVKNRNYYALDVTTGAERLLARDPSVGWLFSPVYSPDHQRIALAWNRQPNPGVWIIDRQHSRETRVYGPAMPTVIGWSADGRALLAVEGKRAAYRDLARELGETLTEAKILSIDVETGTSETVVDLPFEEVGGIAMGPDGSWFVCVVYSSRSDVWAADNFDKRMTGDNLSTPAH